MNIIFSRAAADSIRNKFTVLEIDTIKLGDRIIECFCVLDAASVLASDIQSIDGKVELHNELILNYREQRWDECLELVELLKGSFDGELDTFYDSIESRVLQYQEEGVGEDWHWSIAK